MTIRNTKDLEKEIKAIIEIVLGDKTDSFEKAMQDSFNAGKEVERIKRVEYEEVIGQAVEILGPAIGYESDY